MKFMDVNTKAHFRSNDFQIIKIQSACVSWQEYLKQPVKMTRASMPHPSDGQIVQHMRMVNIAEIGSNTREFREIGDLVFEADLEEKKEAQKAALARAQAAERSLQLTMKSKLALDESLEHHIDLTGTDSEEDEAEFTPAVRGRNTDAGDGAPLRCQVGWMILDGQNPLQVIARASKLMLSPKTPW